MLKYDFLDIRADGRFPLTHHSCVFGYAVYEFAVDEYPFARRFYSVARQEAVEIPGLCLRVRAFRQPSITAVPVNEIFFGVCFFLLLKNIVFSFELLFGDF